MGTLNRVNMEEKLGIMEKEDENYLEQVLAGKTVGREGKYDPETAHKKDMT